MELFKELSPDSILMELSKDVQPLEDLLGLLGSADPLSTSPDVTGEFSFPQQHAVQDSLGFDSLLSDLQQFDKADDAFGDIMPQGPTDFSDVLLSLSEFATTCESQAEQQHSVAAVDNFSTLDIESLLCSQDSLSGIDLSPVDSLCLDSSAFLQSLDVSSTVSPAVSSTSSSYSSPVGSPVGSPQPDGTRTPQLKKLLLDPNFKGWEEPQVMEVSPAPEPAGYIEVEVEVVAASPSSTASDYTLISEADSLPSSPRSSARYQPYQKQRGRGEDSRKERKRLQNQQAATRYRQKKKQENGTVGQQSKALLDENKRLEDKVDGLGREIKYMKDLLVEVYKAKGLISDAEKLQRSLT